jgi:hypothetical protein
LRTARKSNSSLNKAKKVWKLQMSGRSETKNIACP